MESGFTSSAFSKRREIWFASGDLISRDVTYTLPIDIRPLQFLSWRSFSLVFCLLFPLLLSFFSCRLAQCHRPHPQETWRTHRLCHAAVEVAVVLSGEGAAEAPPPPPLSTLRLPAENPSPWCLVQQRLHPRPLLRARLLRVARALEAEVRLPALLLRTPRARPQVLPLRRVPLTGPLRNNAGAGGGEQVRGDARLLHRLRLRMAVVQRSSRRRALAAMVVRLAVAVLVVGRASRRMPRRL